MDYKAKLAVVRRLQPAVTTVVNRYYADDVGMVRHTPKVMYRVFKRNLKAQGAKVKRSELRRFSKIAFLLYNHPETNRKHVELVFASLLAYSFILDMVFGGFRVSVTATKRALKRLFAKVVFLFAGWVRFFDRLFDLRLYLYFISLLI